MNIVEGYVDRMAKVPIRENPGDYIGDDGILYCGKCRTPKQKDVRIGSFARRVPCMCRCENEAYNAQEAETKRQREREAIARMRTSGIHDPKMLKSTFDADDRADPVISDMMRRYVEHWPEMYEANQGMVLSGDVGCGKTFFAGCVANALIDKGVPVLCTDFAKILGAVQKVPDRNEYLRDFDRYQLLIIDDLGAERQSDYAQEVVFSVINNRVRLGRPMILTTNISIAEIKAPEDIRYKRIYDRLTEACLLVRVKGSSRRGKIGQEKAEKARALLLG